MCTGRQNKNISKIWPTFEGVIDCKVLWMNMPLPLQHTSLWGEDGQRESQGIHIVVHGVQFSPSKLLWQLHFFREKRGWVGMKEKKGESVLNQTQREISFTSYKQFLSSEMIADLNNKHQSAKRYELVFAPRGLKSQTINDSLQWRAPGMRAPALC